MNKKLTIQDIIVKKAKAEKISMLTAYDVSFARMLDSVGIDILLIGDSLGMVLLGYDSTVPVTMDEMLHHCRAVSRGARRALVVGDMPFLSYQVSIREAIANAGRFLKEAGCDAVKLEGGLAVCDTVRALVKAGIPVMGHIGLTPQTASQLGGYKVQGRDLESAHKMIAEAKALAEAGVFSLVLECIPAQLAEVITESIRVPTIGIGAGVHCDGQVLVTHDLLGMFEKFTPTFVKKFANLASEIKEAVGAFKEEVESGHYPADEHSFTMQADLRELLDERKPEDR